MTNFEKITDIEEIHKLIPQKPPIVMIDSLLLNDEAITRTSLLIKDENIFCKNGVLHEPGVVENIAQTAAIRAGYFYNEKGATPPIGFIGAIKNLHINFLPKVGKELVTEIKVETEIFGATVISAKSKCEEQVVAECEMKIFLINVQRSQESEDRSQSIF